MSPETEPNFSHLRNALAGRYEIQAPIGRGGMGAVYLAREVGLDRAVAIKVLPPERATDPRSRERFLHEARTVAGLSHPHIVPIFAVRNAGEYVFFAMAYVDGETLAERVARHGPLTPLAAARLLREIGGALACAHARGIVHRDVKPDNILLDRATGGAMLSDFGIAYASPAGRPAAPRGPVLGTAAFMSPEQARGEAVDGRSDLYSLGVVAYYALSGRLPFNAPNDAAFMALHIAEPAPPLAARAPDVPAALAKVVDRCLAKDPWSRFPDADALVHAVVAAVEPPPAPLPVRAFMIRSLHLTAAARVYAVLTGCALLPAAVWSWLNPADLRWRGLATAILALAVVVPVAIAVRRARRLLAAGVSRRLLIEALEIDRARRLEELAFAYGPGPTRVGRLLQGIAWLGVIVAATAVALLDADAAPAVVAALPPAATIAGGTAIGAAILARAGTERRSDPVGESRLRFWRGAVGRWVFHVAALMLRPPPGVVSILARDETPA